MVDTLKKKLNKFNHSFIKNAHHIKKTHTHTTLSWIRVWFLSMIGCFLGPAHPPYAHGDVKADSPQGKLCSPSLGRQDSRPATGQPRPPFHSYMLFLLKKTIIFFHAKTKTQCTVNFSLNKWLVTFSWFNYKNYRMLGGATNYSGHFMVDLRSVTDYS